MILLYLILLIFIKQIKSNLRKRPDNGQKNMPLEIELINSVYFIEIRHIFYLSFTKEYFKIVVWLNSTNFSYTFNKEVNLLYLF